MLKHLYIFFLPFILLCSPGARGAVFTVTSNADGGTGTLRQFIGFCNSNGITESDTIYFNFTDLTEAGRTINLLTELPALSSNIVIDGTSQPGLPIGISAAKVILYLDHYTSFPFTYLMISNASEVSILGICFKYFNDPNNGGGEHYAIGLRNSNRIRIGSPGKGNLFMAVRASITNRFWNYSSDSIRDLTIQSNVIGFYGPSGTSAGGYVSLDRARNITVGGPTPAEGNIILASMEIFQSLYPNPEWFVRFQNNLMGTNGTFVYNLRTEVHLYGNNLDDSTVFRSFFQNNIFHGSNWYTAIGLTQIRHRSLIQGNLFGTDPGGINCIGQANDIGTYQCGYVLIGGDSPAEENIIGGDIYVGNDRVEVRKNKLRGKIVNPATQPDDPFIKILTYDNNLITGLANPGARIQLYTNRCDYPPCIKRVYLTSVQADAAGNWQYAYADTDPNIVATATRSDSSTSEFSEPKGDHLNMVVRPATCGRNNGSITGIIIKEGTHIEWRVSSTNQVVSTDTNLVNVGPGYYSLTVRNGANGCSWSTGATIYNLDLPPTLNADITHASCGSNNGRISTGYDSQWSKWLNASNDSIGTGGTISNLMPGTYYLKVWISFDSTCTQTYGPWVINNISGPSLNLDNTRILTASCNNANGSILDITAQNVTGTPYIQWLDSLNNPVGSALNLSNVTAGRYRMKFRDQSGCDTITTPYFIIPATGRIQIDTSGIISGPAGCTVSNGFIRNIHVSGADTYQWINTVTGVSSGATIDINGLASGSYQLLASNTTGCSAQSPVINISQSLFIPIGVTTIQSRNAICGENNGLIRVTGFTNDSLLYTFQWTDSTTGQLAGTGTGIGSLGAGTFILTATDTNGCRKQILKSTIGAFPKPVADLAGMQIADDLCSTSAGSITGIRINGIYGPTVYQWRDGGNNPVGNTLNLQQVPAGQYYLTVTDGGVCSIQAGPFTVSNSDHNVYRPLYDDQLIPRNTPATLQVKNFQAGTYFLYADAAGTQLIQQNNTGIFQTAALPADCIFYIRHITGSCSGLLVPVKITTVDKSWFAIASGFTPNNDGLNDRLLLKVIGYLDVEFFTVYNRNGEQVFSTRTVNTGWDGTWKGIGQDSGVFIWFARGKDINGKTVSAKGTFVLIR